MSTFRPSHSDNLTPISFVSAPLISKDEQCVSIFIEPFVDADQSASTDDNFSTRKIDLVPMAAAVDVNAPNIVKEEKDEMEIEMEPMRLRVCTMPKGYAPAFEGTEKVGTKLFEKKHFASTRLKLASAGQRPNVRLQKSVNRPVSETNLLTFKSFADDPIQSKSLNYLHPNSLLNPSNSKDNLRDERGSSISKETIPQDDISMKIRFARSCSRSGDHANMHTDSIDNNLKTKPLLSEMNSERLKSSEEKTSSILKGRLNRFSFDATSFLLPKMEPGKLDSISPVSTRSGLSSNDSLVGEKSEKEIPGHHFEIKKLLLRLKLADEKIKILENQINANENIANTYQTTIDNLTLKIERLNSKLQDQELEDIDIFTKKRNSVKFSTLKPVKKDGKDGSRMIRRHASCENMINMHFQNNQNNDDRILEPVNDVPKKKKTKFSLLKVFSRKKSNMPNNVEIKTTDPQMIEEWKKEAQLTDLRLLSLEHQQQIQQLTELTLKQTEEINLLRHGDNQHTIIGL